jgi:GNAT superfamily N-acetyltransferase
MEVLTRPLGQERIDEILSLYAAVFGPEAAARLRRRWRWQFHDNPAVRLAPPVHWIAEDGEGDLLGFVQSFPARLKILDRVEVVQFPADLMVTNKARGKGIGTLLLAKVTESAGPLACVFGYARASEPLFRRLGYQEIPCVPVSIRPLRPGRIVSFFLASRSGGEAWWRALARIAPSLTTPFLHPLAAVANRLRAPKARSGLALERAEAVGPEFDSLWNSLASDFPIVFVRDREFLAWRALQDPEFRHVLVTAKDQDGSLAGYADCIVTDKRGLKVGKIMDLFCRPQAKDVAESLLAGALGVFREEGAHAVTCLGLHPSIRSVVRRFLYLSPGLLTQPALVRPRNEELRDAVFHADLWHVGLADGDEGYAP